MRGFQNKNHSICEVGLVLESLLGDLAPRCSKSLATKFVLSTRQLVVGIDPLCDQYCCENHSDFEADETMNGTMVEICYLAAGCLLGAQLPRAAREDYSQNKCDITKEYEVLISTLRSLKHPSSAPTLCR